MLCKTNRSPGIQTSIQIYNGATVVMGGMITENRVSHEDKIPLLGDIPLLGWFFRHEKQSRSRTEVLVFITPYVLDTPAQIEDDSRNAKASLDTRGVWDALWSRSRMADPVSEKAHNRALENGRQTVLPPRYPLSGELSELN